MDHISFYSVTELLALSMAIIYAIGLSINSLHLSRFGITPTPLARPQYLLCGIWCLLTALLPIMITAFLAKDFSENYASIGTSRDLASRIASIRSGAEGVFAILGLVTWGILIIAFIFKIRPDTDTEKLPLFFARQSWKFIKAGIIASLTIAMATLAAYNFSDWNAAASLGTQIKVLSLAFTNLVLSLLIAFFYIAYYATSIYPIIPQALGGGRPVRIRFFLRNGFDPELRKRIERANGWDLLLRTGSSYFVVSNADGENSIEITHDLVEAVIATCPDRNQNLPIPFNW